ncbi:MAG: hypothetical protein A3J74_03500 [Elusimicrobia bacterium RIFCSPHIGHO2_02_FULL_57_9]|nr:MAG: hypothetical protein A3J74_03500 [Elusimicrobia bacterium RIFCSPHIGHO2_02_FULL_57_9]
MSVPGCPRGTAGRSLGVDLGGTWMRLCLADSSGKILKRRRLPAIRWTNLLAVLSKLDKSWRIGRLQHLTAGCCGIWRGEERRRLKSSLRGMAKQVRVMSDLELAHGAAFNGGAGILLIGGTGSVALGRDDKKCLLRIGGLGPLLGDEGSAFWIGRQALKNQGLAQRWPEGLALRLAHGADPVRQIAGLTRFVFRWARQDARARALLRQAAEKLADLAQELSRRLDFHGPIPVSWHGGLFKDKNFRDGFLRALKKHNRRFIAHSPSLASEIAAARLK